MNDSHIVRYSRGTGTNFGKAKNRTSSLAEFVKLFSQPTRTKERFKQYLAMSPDEQLELKSIDGWIYRTHIEGKSRNASSGKPSDIFSLDFDFATTDFLDLLELGLLLPGFEFIVHSTRRHDADKPRLRIWGFFSRPVTNEEYGPLSRIIARMFDPEMRMIDKVSFRKAQMMFLPTCSIDGDWFFTRSTGKLFDPDAIFEEFERTDGDWRDLTNLPRVEDEELREHHDKAEDPTTKRGPVGDFCRAYDVIEAIEKFDLPYTPVDDSSEKPRYTYTGGTTSSGAVIEDGGLFLYSHHGSDPCADMLVNSFDLVRIHKFGHLDAETTRDTPIGKWPSFAAMIEFIAEDDGYRRAAAQSQYDMHAMFDDLVDDESADSGEPESADSDDDEEDLVGDPKKAKAKKKGPKKDWHLDLEINKSGRFESSLPNITAIVQCDPRVRLSVEFNEFRKQVVTRRPLLTRMDTVPHLPVENVVDGEAWQDHHSDALRMMLEAPNGPGKPGWGLKVTDRDLKAAVDLAARKNPFHPVREVLDGLTWDGEARAERLFIRYLGAEDNAYHREIARKFLVGAVARVYEPGHKFDFVPVLEGMQGKRKSTFIAILALHWFGEMKGDFSDEKRLVEQMMGHWIMELPELSAVTRSIVEEIKAFISATHSSVRLSYGRLPTVFPRQTVFIGSTNEHEYLVDHTGNRRWWPVRCDVDFIDTDHLAANVHQIWAEAKTMYDEMRAEQPEGTLPLYLQGREAQEIALRYQEDRRQQTDADVNAGLIGEWLNTPQKVERFDVDGDGETVIANETCLIEVWQEALGNDKKPNRMEALMLAKAMRALGWERDETSHRFGKWGKQKVWRRPDDDLV